ncbi:MAG: hypothetical protein CML50_12875 [Rhodobacteraceae bacterium]|jgi:hypothetical protein|uniref:Porin n=1 Tax=Salipiger profundus TaxID=1229727 RepID=A0A1U7D7P8_9RHOB|nr:MULTISPECIES: hypothetical protein [Salipiger]APX24096.1 hypothetical protein Ga0080559_TMP3300 [Salipiger profundus]MAB06887.1 hypothetical protein [Paracoccaceae bacterium]GFZ94619.1 hypothetical protein GCM10011326_01760 [Salipiger profundus]SFB91236.1 hypothetical protein SAMN05444415_101366 [Salipiger profundus]
MRSEMLGLSLGVASCFAAYAVDAQAAADPSFGRLDFPSTVAPLNAQSPAGVPDWWQAAPGPDAVDTLDPAVPGAEEVLEDTPNSFAWSRYQVGTVGGWSYRLFPDGSAFILPDDPRAVADYILKCTTGVSCDILTAETVVETIPATGAPKPELPDGIDGLGLARYLARWVLAGTGTPPQAAAPPPEQDTTGPEPVETTEAPSASPVPPTVPASTTTSAAPSGNATCVQPDPFYPDACRAAATPPAAAAPASAPARQPVQPSAPEDERMTLAERFRLSCSVSSGATLQYADDEDQHTRYGKLKVSLGCYARLSEKLSMQASVISYPIKGQQAPWDPDFTYSFTYKVTDRISLNYSNYSARFSGGDSNFVSSILKGSLRGYYKLPDLPIGETRKAACSVGIGLPDPREHSLTLGCSMGVTDKLRVGLTGYAYPKGVQEPWNPDYTYTASYQVNDRIQVSYANYSNNRLPWNRADTPGPGPLGGSVTVSYKLKF